MERFITKPKHQLLINWYKFNQPYSFVYYATLIDAAAVTTTQQSNLNIYTTAPNSNGINLYFNQIRAYFGQSIADQILNEFLPNSNLYVDKLMLNEWHIYGSSRLGIYKAEVLVASKTLTQSDAQSANGSEPTYSAVEQNPPVLDYANYSQIRGAKNYELSNHLGNVLVVVTDKKTYNCGNTELINANFDNGSYNNIFPITSNTSMSLLGNKLNVSGTNTQVGTLFNNEGEAGRIFKVDFDLTIGSGISQVWFETNASYNSTGGGLRQNITNNSSSGHVSFTFTAPQGAYRFKIGGTGTGTYSVDNLIVKEVGPGRYQAEIVTANDYSPFGAPMPGRSFKADNVLVKTTLSNSNFTTGTDGWVATTNATLSNLFGNIRATVTAVNAGMKKTFSTEPGKTYRVMFKINLRGWPYMYIKDKYTNTNLLSITNYIVPGDASYTFTATGFETDVIFNEASNPAGSIQLANFTLEEVEANIGYRFAFNGQEKDDEVSGAGNTMTATFWEYDARLGRRWNLDPKPIAGISNYVCFANNPIALTDPFGDVVKPTGDKKDIKKFVKQISKATGNKYAIDKDGNLYNKLGVENTKTTKNKSAELGQIVKSAIEDKETFKLDLVNNDASVLIDNYNTGKVDVGDFAKMDRISQAGQFAHFLTERMENPGDYSIANRNDPNFLNIAHPKAMIAESKVVTAMLKIPYALGIQTQQPKTWKDVQGVEHHLVELRTTYGSAIFGVDVLTISKRTNTSMTTYREDFEASGTFYSKYSRLK